MNDFCFECKFKDECEFVENTNFCEDCKFYENCDIKDDYYCKTYHDIECDNGFEEKEEGDFYE